MNLDTLRHSCSHENKKINITVLSISFVLVLLSIISYAADLSFNLIVKKVENEYFLFDGDNKMQKVEPVEKYTGKESEYKFIHLRPKQGVEFRYFVEHTAGSDLIGFTASSYKDVYAVVNRDNAAYFFEPIDTKDKAYEYAIFVRYGLGSNVYEKDFGREIKDKDDFDNMLSKMSEVTIYKQPVIYSHSVEKKDDFFVVERLSFHVSGYERIVYTKYKITPTGEFSISVEEKIAAGKTGIQF
ncbi:MAG: hypothetical protein KJ923_00740 [Candidatus Omnitrophica bacterium]|nr:hypothetical protein [Candidatus Omnitrophota bacterium]MBU1905509.1 hypothetical protein [Candidatus Omnitrophota bacterium]